MNRNFPPRRAVVAILAALSLALASGFVNTKIARAQTTKPSASMDEDEGPVLRRHRMSDVELGRLRMLELQSGAFHAAHEEAHAQEVIGPPLSDREKMLHAMDRLTFGVRPGEVQQALESAAESKEKLDPWMIWAKTQVDADKIDDHELEADVAKRFPWVKMSTTELKKEFPYKGDEKTWRDLTKALPELVLYRAARSKRQFKEVMCEFWRNHFCIDNSPGEAKVRSWAAVRYEDDVIRAHVFGKFKDMLFASATHPAMLEFLDNGISKANNWNENYAREVMELHTLGVDRGYNNYDVQELSKVLTGWTWDTSTYEFTFKADWHQPGQKSFLGMSIPQGYNGGEQALYVLAHHPNTAEFISRKLCQYLVNDAPPPSLVSRVAAVFQQTEGDLPKVYWAIISSPEFISRENYRAKFKTPFDFVASVLRVTDAKVDNLSSSCLELEKMGQQIYNCQDPTGYYFRSEAWLDPGVLTKRWDYSLKLMRGDMSGIQPSPSFVDHYKSMKIDDELKSMVKELIGDDIGDKTRQSLVKASTDNDHARMLAILLGSPSFQQY